MAQQQGGPGQQPDVLSGVKPFEFPSQATTAERELRFVGRVRALGDSHLVLLALQPHPAQLIVARASVRSATKQDASGDDPVIELTIDGIAPVLLATVSTAAAIAAGLQVTVPVQQAAHIPFVLATPHHAAVAHYPQSLGGSFAVNAWGGGILASETITLGEPFTGLDPLPGDPPRPSEPITLGESWTGMGGGGSTEPTTPDPNAPPPSNPFNEPITIGESWTGNQTPTTFPLADPPPPGVTLAWLDAATTPFVDALGPQQATLAFLDNLPPWTNAVVDALQPPAPQPPGLKFVDDVPDWLKKITFHRWGADYNFPF